MHVRLILAAGLAAGLSAPVAAQTPAGPPSSFEHLRAGSADAGLAAEALGQVHFPFDSSALDAGDRRRLRQVARWLDEHAGARLVIAGHTDPIGTHEYNAGLATRRAEAVRAALIELGVEPDRLVVTVYGENQLAYTADRLNRRAELHATGGSNRAVTAATLAGGGLAVIWSYVPDELEDVVARRR